MTTVLVLGGARSGKSRYAQRLLAAYDRVRYVAPGPVPAPDEDGEWADRVRAHQADRPGAWETVETGDVPGAILTSELPVLVDCLGTWLTRVVDDADAWEDRERAIAVGAAATGRLLDALTGTRRHVVLVSNEAGMGVIPAHPAGRLFRDDLGRLNTAVADACDHVCLVVAGRVLDLSGASRLDAAPRFGLHPDDPS